MRRDSETRQRILDVTVAAIEKDGSRHVRIAEVANRSRVGVPTIYYHFQSRTQLIAEAQVAIYQRLTEPLHVYLPRVEAALANDDQEAFHEALGENTEMAWTLGQLDEKWGIVKLLLDVWSQPKVRDEFCTRLDVQFERWNDAMEHAKDLGWISDKVDSRTLVATFWAASIGQVITSNSPQFNPTPKQVRGFFDFAIRGEAALK
jgi:AcrR family transcriptional regulator